VTPRNRSSRSLITGVGGFLDSHLAEFLVERGLSVWGTVRKSARNNLEHLQSRLTLRPCDVLDGEGMERLVAEARPEVVFHLAAQSLPVLSWKEPEATFQVNVFGTLNLLEAVRKAASAPPSWWPAPAPSTAIAPLRRYLSRRRSPFAPPAPTG